MHVSVRVRVQVRLRVSVVLVLMLAAVSALVWLMSCAHPLLRLPLACKREV